MPSKAKCKVGWKAMGYKSMSDCASYGKKKMTQKAGTSAKQEQDRAVSDYATAANSRMKKKLARNNARKY